MDSEKVTCIKGYISNTEDEKISATDGSVIQTIKYNRLPSQT